MLKAICLILVLLLPQRSLASEIPDSKNLIGFQINVNLVPFTSYGAPELDTLELRLLQDFASYLPVNTPAVNDFYSRGLMIINASGNVMGYVATGGMFEGTYWKFAFDPEMTPAQRTRLLALLIPYVDGKMKSLVAQWSEFKSASSRPLDSMNVRVDFLSMETSSNKWLLERFGQYPQLVVEDTAKGIELSLAQLIKSTPVERTSTDSSVNNIIRGIQFGNAYSPNLRKMAQLQPDGSVVVTDTRTGKTLATIAPLETGTPKISMSSTQLVLDYGPGKKRFHYGVVEFKVLYTVDNWQPRARPDTGLGAGSCKPLFLL